MHGIRPVAIGEDEHMSVDRSLRTQRLQEVRQRLLDGASGLLEQGPWPEVTVEQITSAAGVSRTVFYQHFADRQELLLTLFGEIADELSHVADDWMVVGGADPSAEHRRSLQQLVGVFQRHGRLLQAVRDAAVSDPEVSAAWENLASGIVAETTTAIERDIAAGHARADDPDQMSRALTAMMENYLLRSFGRAPFPDPEAVTDTLATVWVRTLYSGL